MEYNDIYYDTLIIFLIILIFFLIVALCFKKAFQFINEREYIKVQMSSSSTGKEYRYWKRKLKRLFLCYLPLIGRFFR